MVAAILLSILVLLVIVILHEGGHFLACVLLGIPVKALYFGVPLGSRLTLRLDLGKYPLYISPLPLIAAVEVDEGRLDQVPLWRRIVMYAAGPLVNLLSAAVLVIAILGWSEGLAALADLGQAVLFGVNMILSGQMPIHEAVCGPVGAVAISSEIITEGGYIPGSLLTFVLISASIGVFNLLPIPGLDGGRMVVDVLVAWGLPKSWGRVLTVVFMVLLLIFGVIITAKDIMMLF